MLQVITEARIEQHANLFRLELIYKFTDGFSQLVEQIEALHRDDFLTLSLLSIVPKSKLPLFDMSHEYQNGMAVVALLALAIEIELEYLQEV